MSVSSLRRTPRMLLSAVVVLALTTLSGVVLGAYKTQIGMCDGPVYYTLSITSSAENAAAAAYLQREGIASAGLGGYVDGGVAYDEFGAALPWHPASFSLPSSASGFVLLSKDGSWSLAPDSAYSVTRFICSDGQPEKPSSNPSTTAPTTPALPNSTSVPTPTVTSTTVTPTSTPTSSATTAPSSWFSSTPTETPTTPTTTSTTTQTPTMTTMTPSTTETPVELSRVLVDLKTAFDAVASIDVAAHTANVVQLSTAAASSSLNRLAKAYGTVYLGIGECSDTGRTARRVASLVGSPETGKVGFYLPYDLVATSKAATYNLCLLGYTTSVSSGNNMAPPERFALLTATLTVHSISDVVSTLQGTVSVNYEDRLDGRTHTKALVVTGSGTATPFTTDLSPEAFKGFTLSLINNGVNGRSCTPSANAIPFLLADNTLQLSLSSAIIQLITNGEKSVCASINDDTAVVVAKVQEVPLGAAAPKQRYTYGTAIPARLRGISTNSLAKGYVTAFLSSSSQCTTSGSIAAMVEVVLSSDITTSSAAASSTFVPQLFVTAPVSAAGTVRYVCLTYKAGSGGSSSSTTFKLFTASSAASASPVQVSVSGVSVKVPPTKLTVFNGMEGSVLLTKYVAPIASESDQANYDAVVALVGSTTTQHVSFVPLRLTASTTQLEKATACRKTGAAEVKTELKAGVLSLTQSTQMSQSSGVLCINTEYIRVDYAVVDPTTWLRTFGGTSDYESSAFVLSITSTTSNVGDVAPLTFSGSEYHSDMALRLSTSGDCTMGNAALLRQSDDGAMTIVALPATGLGTYTICVGLYTSDDGTYRAAFASTGHRLHLAPYATALSNWKAYVGIQGSTWTSCGGAAACGAKTTQFGLQVCPTVVPVIDESNTGAVVRSWPSRLEDEVNYLGAFTIVMSGNGVAAQAGAFPGGVFSSSTNAQAHCQQYSLLEMTTDGTSYSTSVVATMSRPLVSFKTGSQLSGAVFGLAPWDQSCSDSTIQLRSVLSDNLFRSDSTKGETGQSTFDVSALLYANKEGYYALCYSAGATGGTWSQVTLSYVKVIRDRLTDGVQVEAIGTGNPSDNQESILLWQTQSTTWHVAGEFDSAVAVSLLLVWDDATCQVGTPAYTTPVIVLSTTGGKVQVDTSLIADSPADGLTHYLHPCYKTALAKKASPLSFEARRHRQITLSALSLSSINYLPHFAIAYNTLEETVIQLTDPRKPPLTQVALFRATSLNDPDATTAHCSITSQNLVRLLSTTTDAFGLRWLVVPPPSSVLGMEGGANREVYLILCATASTAASPPFEPVAAYITINHDGSDTTNGVYLDLTFAPMNLSTDVLDETGAAAALSAYTTSVLPTIQGAQVLVSDMGFNHFALYIEPQVSSSYTLTSPTASLYSELVAGTKLPVHAQSTVNGSSFVLKSVEGRRLGTQSVHSGYPFAALRTSAATVVVTNGATTSIALFCIIVTPTVVGFVIFSVQRTIPSLNRDKEGGSGPDSKTDKGPTVYIEAGDSPPPRNPRNEAPSVLTTDDKSGSTGGTDGKGDSSGWKDVAAVASGATAALPPSQMELAVKPNAEDTAANPLYDDSEDDVDAVGPTIGRARAAEEGAGGKTLARSPPLRNDTFAMGAGKTPDGGASATAAASAQESNDDLR